LLRRTPRGSLLQDQTTPVVGLDNTDGSITVTTSSYVSSSQTLKKGDMNKPIVAIKAQATVGKVAVTRFDVHFNSRPWLLFSSLTLSDSNGKVLATKNLNSSADVTEITVGSDYLVRFDGVNASVVPGTDTTFVVNANVLAASDKITGQTVTVSTDTSGIRTINGLGYTDSVGVAVSNSVTLSSTGSTGDLYTNVSPSTPNTRTESVSTTNVVTDIVLGAYDMKLQNQSGTVNALSFQIKTNKGFTGSTMFQNVRLYNGSTLLGGVNTFNTSNGVATAAFTNLTIPLSQDVWKTLTLKADVIATSSAFVASSTLVSSTVVGTDGNYNTITLSNASDRVANDVTFVPNAGIVITAITATKGNVTTPTSGTWLAAYPQISFTITNTGSNPIYVSKTPNLSLATTTSSGPSASTTVSSVTASGSTSGATSVPAFSLRSDFWEAMSYTVSAACN
jgi:hypothetical protein